MVRFLLHLILEDMIAYAIANGVIKDDTIAQRDLFGTKIMGVLTPAPSTVRRKFAEKYENSPKHATQFYYQFSQITNYIRVDRIEKDEKLAVLPARLKKEMSDLEEAILRGEYSFYRAKGNRNCLYKGFRGCRRL